MTTETPENRTSIRRNTSFYIQVDIKVIRDNKDPELQEHWFGVDECPTGKLVATHDWYGDCGGDRNPGTQVEFEGADFKELKKKVEEFLDNGRNLNSWTETNEMYCKRVFEKHNQEETKK